MRLHKRLFGGAPVIAACVGASLSTTNTATALARIDWCRLVSINPLLTSPANLTAAIRQADADIARLQQRFQALALPASVIAARAARLGRVTGRSWVTQHAAVRRDLDARRQLIACLRQRLAALQARRAGDPRLAGLRRRLERLWRLGDVTGRRFGRLTWVGDPASGPIIVHDGPTCRTPANQALTLLLRTPGGREAVPGDVFYCHSRLLERAARTQGITLNVDPSVTPDGNVILSLSPTIETVNRVHPVPNTNVSVDDRSLAAQNALRGLVHGRDGGVGQSGRIPGDLPYISMEERPAPRGIVDVGIDYFHIHQPDLNFGQTAGGGPLHGFDNSFDGVAFTARAWWRLADLVGGFRPRLGVEVNGGVFGGTERRGDTSTPGFIARIDGANPALTPITATRNTRLRLDGFEVGGRLASAWERRLQRGRLLLGLLMAGVIAYSHRTYDYSSLVSGGGAFFSDNISLRMKTLFVGVALGGYLTWRLTEAASVTVRGEIAPGYQNYWLRATQSGTALPPAGQVSDTRHGFAFRALIGLALHYHFSSRLRLTGSVSGTYDSAMPSILYPLAGGVALAAARHGGWKVKVGLLLVWKFGVAR